VGAWDGAPPVTIVTGFRSEANLFGAILTCANLCRCGRLRNCVPWNRIYDC
jgi:hypothetical protein